MAITTPKEALAMLAKAAPQGLKLEKSEARRLLAQLPEDMDILRVPDAALPGKRRAKHLRMVLAAIRPGRSLLVSRHAGAIEWLRLRHGFKTEQAVDHLDEQEVVRGDTVIGTLPLPLVARLVARGVEVGLIEINLPAEERGRELSAEDMDRLGARLVRAHARTEPW